MSRSRNGMTLLEIMLSLAILGGAMAVIGEMSRLGVRNAMTARDTTQALLLADSIIAELRLGLRSLDGVFDSPILASEFVDTDAADPSGVGETYWLYSIDSTTLDDHGLTAVAVTVTKNDGAAKPVSVRLVRYIVDPEVEQAEIDAAAEAAADM